VPYIVTSDVSARMIESALAQGLPAIRQPLQDLIWFPDCTFDAVIVAYGTHHIPPPERRRAIAEAHRVLKPGGRIVLQDFEVGCPTTRWYEDTLDRYTLTGHKYEYFTRGEFHDLLTGAGLAGVEVFDVYDPLILYADDARQARLRLLDYVFTLFALEKLAPDDGRPTERFWDELEAVIRESSTFEPAKLPAGAGGVHELTVARDGARYRAEIPRVCLVATGWRPAVAT
jgi:SAM-dependent methyltransferase